MVSKYTFGRGFCWYCLCEVCTRHKCPHPSYGWKWLYCAHMDVANRCPTLKCDYFTHKEKHKVYRVKRRGPKRQDVILEKLNQIEEKLDKLKGE